MYAYFYIDFYACVYMCSYVYEQEDMCVGPMRCLGASLITLYHICVCVTCWSVLPGVGKGREVTNEKEYKRREKEDRVQDIMCMSRVTDPSLRRSGWSDGDRSAGNRGQGVVRN